MECSPNIVLSTRRERKTDTNWSSSIKSPHFNCSGQIELCVAFVLPTNCVSDASRLHLKFVVWMRTQTRVSLQNVCVATIFCKYFVDTIFGFSFKFSMKMKCSTVSILLWAIFWKRTQCFQKLIFISALRCWTCTEQLNDKMQLQFTSRALTIHVYGFWGIWYEFMQHTIKLEHYRILELRRCF